MKRWLAAAAYVVGGAGAGLAGLLILGFALVPLIGTVIVSVVTRGTFLFLGDGSQAFDLVIAPLLFTLLGVGVGLGGLALLLHGIEVGWRDRVEQP
jgi:hypothetical protein